jgi:hypothetical protein
MGEVLEILKDLAPEAGGTWGDTTWSTSITGTAGATDVGTKVQSTKLTVNHHLWVYYADAEPKPSYHVIHQMTVAANPVAGTDHAPLANRSDARGFFNSSVRVGYRDTPTVSAGCSVTEMSSLPDGGQDAFDAQLDGPGIEMYGRSGTTTVFRPTFQIRNRVEKWSLEAQSGPPSWELYQREVWNAYGIDGPVDGQSSVRVPADWYQQLFGGSPFGRLVEMPKASFGTVGCEMLARWQVKGPFSKTSRAAVLTIGVDYTHRVNLIHNGNVGDGHEPRRICAVSSKTDESKVLNLHEIAVPHD